MDPTILSRVEQFVRFLLGKSLDKRLHYHNLAHTLNAVKYAASLASAQGLSKEDTELVLIAEWFHDTGFTVTYTGHEEESAHIASGFLESHLPTNKINVVMDCIRATTRGFQLKNALHHVMHDADYYHLFQPDYFQLIENLRREVNEVLGQSLSVLQWHEQNSLFLAQHSFYTATGKSRWEEYKDALIKENSLILSKSF
jgi:predicted metal-dependent HD superfamily phosphohydrolase